MGSRGFIGKSFVEYLGARQYEVVEYNTSNPVINSMKLNDSTRDLDSLIWCASKVNPSSAETDHILVEQEFSEWENFLDIWGTKVLKNTPIYFLSSGGCVYSGNEIPFSESSPAIGINNYGKLKSRMEQSLLERNLTSTILRVSNVFGPNQPHGRGQGVIAEWHYAVQNSQKVKVYGSLSSFRDYIYLEDFCSALEKILNISETQSILNIGSGIASTLSDVLEGFGAYIANPTEIEYLEYRNADREGYVLDITKLSSLINWTPDFTLEAGIVKICTLGG